MLRRTRMPRRGYIFAKRWKEGETMNEKYEEERENEER
jgi:hypothetical protein